MDHVPSQHEHDADDRDGRRALTGRARRLLLAAAALLAAAGFLGLGIWQVERRAWKLDLIARVEARVHAAPAPLSHFARSVDPHAYEYRRVRAEGVFIHDRETLVQALTARGAGFWVMTPLRTDRGLVLINRGFVPPERSDPKARRAGQTDARIAIVGLMRASERGGGFLRANDPAADRWYSRDVGAIARARGLNAVAPFFIDADARPNPAGYPVGGLTVVRFPNSHLVYALTWFALAALSAGGAVLLIRRPGGR